MRVIQFVSGVAGFLIIAACVSAPENARMPAKLSSTLQLCGGTVISNAPRTNARRHIIGYYPETSVRGETLFRAPVNSCLSSAYGPRRGGASGFHHGVDLYTRNPAPVYAGGDGVVKAAARMRGYGHTIIIRHRSGVETRYAHLSAYAPGIKPGARVRRGDYIGRTGKTGNATAVHLHYEVLVDGRRYNPLTVGG
ncbi:M23 family metallopeptidase [Hyphococcus sp.]|uniref:M23 family metallopeptidase n=1 Tax=Hyphococcus sp. TaxID=2038636 RepID=UPI003CCB8125